MEVITPIFQRMHMQDILPKIEAYDNWNNRQIHEANFAKVLEEIEVWRVKLNIKMFDSYDEYVFRHLAPILKFINSFISLSNVEKNKLSAHSSGFC